MLCISLQVELSQLQQKYQFIQLQLQYQLQLQQKYQYSTTTKVSIYKFPKNLEERKRCSEAIRGTVYIVTDYTAVCQLHWPNEAPFESKYGKQRPLNPPSVFKNIPPSCLATPASKVRKIVTLSSFRSILPDELNDFLKEDELIFDDIQSLLSDNNNVIVFQLNKKSLHIQSKMYKLGVPLFILVTFNDYSFVANHNGTTCNISSLALNKLKLIKTKSALFEAVRFLKNKESSLQSNILFEHLNAMRKVNVGEVLYTLDIICRAYEYFAMRRSLYDCLCID
ncbi:uncharacterized protein LOC136077640 [Hydra vulgaris]|uniref:Uncharacterized protein LOC136077640 n=1 Tax=Hydra vulgaris TaxID=6087 RepID=A0ABM4BG52_HYDVU